MTRREQQILAALAQAQQWLDVAAAYIGVTVRPATQPRRRRRRKGRAS